MLNLPNKVTIVDVAPRDGLQSFPRWIETETKIAIVDRLSEAGFPVIEVAGFVHPRAVPNLSDAEEVLAGITRRPGTVYRALVPNARGAERAAHSAAPPDEILGLITPSERYLKKNQNMTIEQAIDQAIRAFEIAGDANIGFVMAVAGAFWDIYGGRTPEDKVLHIIGRCSDAGIRRFYLGGSMGMEDPRHVSELFAEVKARWPELETGFHVHNMAGCATANILAALDAGATFVEGSICGVGGGVAMPGGTGSVGNLPSEDIVYLLNEMGIETGIDTEDAIAASRDIAEMLGIQSAGHVAHCGSRRQLMALGRENPAINSM